MTKSTDKQPVKDLETKDVIPQKPIQPKPDPPMERPEETPGYGHGV